MGTGLRGMPAQAASAKPNKALNKIRPKQTPVRHARSREMAISREARLV
jgi:hypothetical protein